MENCWSVFSNEQLFNQDVNLKFDLINKWNIVYYGNISVTIYIKSQFQCTQYFFPEFSSNKIKFSF